MAMARSGMLRQHIFRRPLREQVKLGAWHRKNQYSSFAYTIQGHDAQSDSTSGGLYLAITNESRGKSLASLRGPGFKSP